MYKWISNYKDNGIWCKGAIHVHTDKSPCGHYSLEKVTDIYGGRKLKYDFIAITDHDYITDVSPCQGNHGLVLIPGDEESFGMSHIVAVKSRKAYRHTKEIFCKMLEAAKIFLKEHLDADVYTDICERINELITSHQPNYTYIAKNTLRMLIGILDEKKLKELEAAFEGPAGKADYQGILDNIIDDGGIAIMAHPHWLRDDYWGKDMLSTLYNYTGIEIVNGDYPAAVTNVATDVWDYMLSKGRRVWGFGGDDFHNFNEFARVWNVANVEEKSAGSIMNSLKQGNFYVSTGLWLSGIRSEGDKIIVTATDDNFTARYDKIFRFIGKDGELLHTVCGKSPEAVYKARGDESYVRVQVILETGQTAYTQPFFLDK